ncbi:2TM domain-containing protein [Colwellia sp. MB02u-18]|uniref:2TM domain-containing protein n=1 Tax=unclassified Colwellia TaxID=196834 RepID=UPI0015F6782D|nr:2TM domain-containing protein [Colwellia sp. MB3u-45]MBA6268116.1 2TM domain-containing protein [Colwellia sp. MB3u-43]MBA6322568.1 2TM domain-containing protein [Colwellia sp. MB02u-19]MBA6326146.1 2TM domain-containing protein [Colwellia sp. MB02u-18]MBA6331605.1 2TM domain-containing protein [Colwellia sp. MB02u-12]MBA6344264.1 2TM domain-containing protein [Colwellia sp. MB02u-1]
MMVRQLRLKRAWSQEQLAQFSGLNIRTIQRIERGQKAGLESLKSLAAVFEIELDELLEKENMNSSDNYSAEESRIIDHVRDIKGFYSHLINYTVIILALFLVNFLTSPGYYWAWWAAFGWGVGLISHGISVFELYSFFGADWEKKQIEKRLGKKL